MQWLQIRDQYLIFIKVICDKIIFLQDITVRKKIAKTNTVHSTALVAFQFRRHQKYFAFRSDVVCGWVGQALSQREFRSSVNPIPTRGGGADCFYHITACPPGYENLTTYKPLGFLCPLLVQFAYVRMPQRQVHIFDRFWGQTLYA